jgi:outer membrane receptor for ferrienterochelin and colicins
MKTPKALPLILFFLAVFFSLSATEPPTVLRGKIVSNKEAVSFATVSVKGTTIGTVTNENGHFELKKLPAGDFTIRVQSVGYKAMEVPYSRNNLSEVLEINMEADRIGLNEVVVTANRYEANRQQAPVIVNVLNAGLLQAGNAMCMADGLSLSPGLRIENNCQNCGFQQVRINGLEGPYSQILIDSRPVFSALSGVYGIEQIPIAMIERIEVVRGGGSALYGSNAIAGTINVITREPVKNSFEAGFNIASINGKSFDRNTSFNGSLVSDDRAAGIYLFGVNRNRDHYDANGDGFSEIGLIKANSLGLRSFYKTSNQGKLTFTYHYVGEFRRGGNKFDLQPHETDITEQTDHQINGGELVYDHFSKDLRSKWSVYTSAQHIDRQSYYGAQQDLNAYGSTNDFTVVGGLQWTRKEAKALFGKADFVAGSELQINNMHDLMPGYDRDLKQDIMIAGAYGQSEWKLPKGSLMLGLRLDKHNLIEKVIVSPRVTFLSNITPAIQWRSSISTGFRAPQAFDEDLHIIAVNGGVMLIQLDPNLRPEYSKSISSSIDAYFNLFNKESNLMFEGFYTQLDDVFVLETLDTDEQGNMIVERRNGSGAKVFGINVENRTVISQKMQLQTGFTLQRSRYKEPEAWSDDPESELLTALPKSPNIYGYFHFIKEFNPKLSTTISGLYTGPMKIPHFAGYIPNDELKTTPDFFEVNVKLSHTFKIADGMMVKAEAGIQNLFNSYQQDFDFGTFRDAGYMYGPMRPRTFFVALKIGNLL